ncbi:type II secretion system protein GspL [Solimonas terrae]|uniref:Type II secretion system protein L n=1 Tax=Solimonas terrae TaxID=1396819 RepID=A0A6M2BWL9_9GAMM|nr:type II secretion system protein GspL [Solimonas terrae]NGY06307.1 type II secretion system protein GspL [Solimonas terrae]
MRETLYIRLRSADPAEPVEYCIARADAIASFVVGHALLETLSTRIGPRRVIVLVPSADVRLATVQVPARQAAKVLQAAPFVLEEQLAEDVDTLHFALGARQADQRWPLAIVSQSRLQAWLALLDETGIHADAMIPDVLALQVPDATHCTALIDGDQVLVRSAQGAGFVCQFDDLPFCLELADPEKHKTLGIVVPRGAAVDLSRLGWPVEPRHGFNSALEALLQQLRIADTIDLLQGRYSPKRNRLRWFAPWRMAATLAGAAIGLSLLLHGIDAVRLQRAVTAQDAANVTRYQQIFPGETRIVDLSSQLDQQLKALQTTGGGQFMSLLDVLTQALAAVPGLQVKTLQFRDGVLFAGLTATNLELLDRLKNWFAEARGAQFSVDSANAGADGVQIRVRLSPA